MGQGLGFNILQDKHEHLDAMLNLKITSNLSWEKCTTNLIISLSTLLK